MARELTDFDVLTFDCYGTLIDWETGFWDALQPLLMANRTDAITREKALTTIAKIESAHQSNTPGLRYDHVLERVHRDVAEHFGLSSTPELDAEFGASLPHWPAFPDAADTLRRLKHRFKLVILSNVHRDGFAASNRKLGVEFDAIYTAEDIGSYKPDPRNFEYMLEHLKQDFGTAPERILHVAQSLFHDHVQARAFGLANAWIDRQQLRDGGNWGATAVVEERPEFDFHFPTLAAFADSL